MYEGIHKHFNYVIERSCDYGQIWKYYSLCADLDLTIQYCEKAMEHFKGTQYRIYDRTQKKYIKLIKEGFSYYEI